MANRADRPQDIRNRGEGGRLLRELVRSRRAWLACVAIVLAATVAPTTLKAPAALMLAAVLLGPLIRTFQASQPQLPHPADGVELADAVRFQGFKGEEIPGRTRWRFVWMVLRGHELRISSYWYWRRGTVEVISIRGARITDITTSGPRDLNLKSGLMRIIALELSDGAPLRLAVAWTLEAQVVSALQAHA